MFITLGSGREEEKKRKENKTQPHLIISIAATERQTDNKSKIRDTSSNAAEFAVSTRDGNCYQSQVHKAYSALYCAQKYL